ncbi:hypothetical protein [Desulfonema limicola]|uniref:hypothetical protein n=1 Tax=Desulfonema limicola TaxID=45656 RepID=UPI001A9AAB0F|nr:hypothetical protein [Desulfonema limicola]
MSVVEIVANIIGYGLELLILFVKCLFIYAAFVLVKECVTGKTSFFNGEDFKYFKDDDITDPVSNPLEYDLYFRDPKV